MNILDECDKLIRRFHRDCHFRAVVAGTSGNRISIIRNGQVQADGGGAPIYYAAANGLAAAVAAGQEVMVVDLTGEGGYMVVCRIVR